MRQEMMTPNQQCQSTEGKEILAKLQLLMMSTVAVFVCLTNWCLIMPQFIAEFC